MTASSPAASQREPLLVAALAVLPLLPFLNAAVSIDAPVFLAVARQILVAPLDPFGFDMIWDPTSPHVAHFNQNPPLLSYYLAPWIGLFGEREWVLHAALLPFPLAAALAFSGIARRLTGDALAPVALLVATPAFLLLASTLMLDVPMLACFLVSVYAFLRSTESASARWELAAGAAAAAAGLMKYAGFSIAPLLAAGVLLFPAPRAGGPLTGRLGALARTLGLPLAIWALWGFATSMLYGTPHFAGGLGLVGDRDLDPDAFWNQLASIPIWYGGALVFPVLAGFAALRGRGTEWLVVGVLLGGAAVRWVLPEGEPARRVPLGDGAAVVGALCFAGAVVVWGRALWPRRLAGGDPAERFVWLWLAGNLVFTAFVNWHVNAADALIAAPPALLLLFRDRDVRPSRRAVAVWTVLALGFSLALTAADVLQRNVYREVARRIDAEIGERPGRRWFVGHWGFQFYLERIGFRAVVPPQYERAYGRSELARDDWIATARNTSQLDVTRNLGRYRIEGVWHWSQASPLPLRATHPDAGAGFYSHHAGYLPFGWGAGALEEVGLGRVRQAPPPRTPAGSGAPPPPEG